MKPFRHKFGITAAEVWVTDDHDLYRKWIAKHIGKVETEANPNCQGRCWGSFIWVRTAADIPFFVHEAIHAVDFWMDERGLEGTEVRSYAVEQLVRAYQRHLARG